MTDRKPDTPAAASPAKPKGGMKMTIIVAGVMALEAAGLVAVFSLAGPSAGKAEAIKAATTIDVGEQTQELLIAQDRYQNLQSGRIWLWEVAVFIRVKNKHADEVNALLESRKNELAQGVGQIVSRAEHAQLREPDHETVRRLATVYLEKVFPRDAEGNSYVDSVIIPRCRGMPGD